MKAIELHFLIEVIPLLAALDFYCMQQLNNTKNIAVI